MIDARIRTSSFMRPTSKFRTHYDNLKVARDAPPEVIRAAYKALAQRHHPDRNPGNERAARIMQIVNASYQVLSNPDARANHDSWIAEQERSLGGEEIERAEVTHDERIRAEPRRDTARHEEGGRGLYRSIAWQWVVDKVRAAIVAILIAVAIGAVMRLPWALSKVEQANRVSSYSSRSVQKEQSRFALFAEEERARAKMQCNAELNLLLDFMRTAIKYSDVRGPSASFDTYVAIIENGQRSNADVQAAALMVWAQREELRAWRKVAFAQGVETCMLNLLRGQPRSLTDWLPATPVRATGS